MHGSKRYPACDARVNERIVSTSENHAKGIGENLSACRILTGSTWEMDEVWHGFNNSAQRATAAKTYLTSSGDLTRTNVGTYHGT